MHACRLQFHIINWSQVHIHIQHYIELNSWKHTRVTCLKIALTFNKSHKLKNQPNYPNFSKNLYFLCTSLLIIALCTWQFPGFRWEVLWCSGPGWEGVYRWLQSVHWSYSWPGQTPGFHHLSGVRWLLRTGERLQSMFIILFALIVLIPKFITAASFNINSSKEFFHIPLGDNCMVLLTLLVDIYIQYPYNMNT